MGTRWEVDDLDWDRVRDELRDRLEDTAAREALISYTDLVAGVDELDGPHSHAVADMLGDISLACHEAGEPLLSALAVYKHSADPGPGFFAIAERLHVLSGTGQDAKLAFWTREVRRCHEYWSNR